MHNTLLEKSELPLFAQIKAEDIVPAVDYVLEQNRNKIKELLNAKTTHTWENFVYPLEKMEDDLNSVWNVVSHLSSVKDNPELRKAHDEALPKLIEYHADFHQNIDLYKAFLGFSEGKEFENLNSAQQKVIQNALRDFKLSGILLETSKKEQLKNYMIKLSELENKFEQNILDATNQWRLLITDKNKLEGIPQHSLDGMNDAAKTKGMEGFLLTLDFPTYDAVMTYALDRNLRFEMYRAYNTVASSAGVHPEQWDNTPIMVDILNLRHKIATLLGFNNFAEYSLAKKMIKKPEEVLNFLTEFVLRVKNKAVLEFQDLQNFALKKYNLSTVEAWDVRFLSEKMRDEQYAFTEDELRPFFPVNKVLAGLFTIAQKLFRINVKEVDTVETWHETVKLFEVYDEEGTCRGKFYIDLYARAHKRQGAWCSDCKARFKLSNGDIQIPIAFISANFEGAFGDKGALLTHDEVITLFHEFGHCLHHILTKMDIPSISGNNGVEWDAIELPSQLLENWCWEKEGLALFSMHYETGEPLPEVFFEKLKKSKNFQDALSLIRQLEYSLFDFKMHLDSECAEGERGSVEKVINQVRSEISIIPTPSFNRFQNRFSHIFSGAYAAGYYSYLWSEVLSADVYEEFKQRGIFDEMTGKRFLETILEQGSSKEALELFIEFKDRKPTLEALLKQHNLIK